MLLPLAQETVRREDGRARAEVIIRDVVHVHWVLHALIATQERESARRTLALLGIRLDHEVRQRSVRNRGRLVSDDLLRLDICALLLRLSRLNLRGWRVRRLWIHAS